MRPEPRAAGATPEWTPAGGPLRDFFAVAAFVFLSGFFFCAPFFFFFSFSFFFCAAFFFFSSRKAATSSGALRR